MQLATRLFDKVLTALGLVRRRELERCRNDAAVARNVAKDQWIRYRDDAARKMARTIDELRHTAATAATRRRQFTEAQDHASALKARCTELVERLDAMREDLSAKARIARLCHAERRAAYTQLAQQLALRAAALQRRGAHAAADAPEARFMEAAPAYDEARRRWLAGARPIGARRVEIGGASFTVPPDAAAGDDSLSTRIVERAWLPWEDIAATRQAVVGGIMLDIGANVGTTSIPRLLLGDFERVYAAEPDADNYACLVGNVLDNRLDGLLLPDRVALSNTTGTARLRRGRQIGGHRLINDAASTSDGDEVRCLTVDAWLERLAINPAAVTFVKIDTQGWDVQVLKGAEGLLRQRHVVWQIEVSPSWLKAAGSSVAELCAFVANHFTHVRTINGSPAVPAPAAHVAAVLAPVLQQRPFANLLLFNLEACEPSVADRLVEVEDEDVRASFGAA